MPDTAPNVTDPEDTPPTDPTTGAASAEGDDSGGVVYLSPHRVRCVTCGALPGQPCVYLASGSPLQHGWHAAREAVPADDM